jgi:hypothetical protein
MGLDPDNPIYWDKIGGRSLKAAHVSRFKGI